MNPSPHPSPPRGIGARISQVCLNCIYLLCIRHKGLLEIIKISITYLNNTVFSYIGKKSNIENSTN